MSGGGDTTTVNNSAVPAWAEPYAKDFLTRTQQVADTPYQGYDGQTVAQMNPYQTAGLNAQAQRAIQGSPVNDAASGELQKTLSGGYLNNNPYLDSIVNRAQGDVVRNMAGVEARSGSFGNSGVQQNTAQQLGDISSQIRGADYNNERNRMSTAVSQAPTIANQDYIDASALQNAGQGFKAQDQQNLTDQYSRWQEAQNYPKEQLNILGSGLGKNYGSTSSQTGPGTNGYAQALGTAATAYGAYNSGGGGGKG